MGYAIRDKSGNLASARYNQGNIREHVFLCFYNQVISEYAKKISTRKDIVPTMKLLIFIFHNGNRAYFAQVS